MFEEVWKRVDSVFAAVHAAFARVEESEPQSFSYQQPGAPQRARRHRITSTGGHIAIHGEFKSITVNGKLLRFQETKKK